MATTSAPSPHRKVRIGQELGPCGLCGRMMIAGPSVDRHHLVPRSRGGKAVIWLHLVCHQKIHSVLSERELARDYRTLESLQAHEDIQKFINWIQRKGPEYVTSHRCSNRRRRR